jgi:hypothetical protein
MLGRMVRLDRDAATAEHPPAWMTCAPEWSCHRLRKLVRGVENGPASDELLDVLRKIAERAALAKTIDDILADTARCQHLARKSYRHTNNFDKIVLGLDREHDFEIRLHIWWNGSADESSYDSDIHNHNWSFVSCILSGEFVNEVFEPDVNGTEYYRYRYSPREDKETFELQFDRKLHLGVKSPVRYRMGDTYFMPAPSPHRFGPVVPTMSSTLLIQLPRQSKQSDVYRSTPIVSQVATVDVPAFSVVEFCDRLCQYRKAMAMN